METQNPQSPERGDSKFKALYWLAAAALTVAVVLDVMEPHVDWLSIAGRVTLVAVLVLLVTAKPAETRAKKVIIYALIAISVGLFIARLAGGGS